MWCLGFSLQWLLLLSTGFSARSTWTQSWRMGLQHMLLLPCNKWNLPGPGIKPVPPSLAGRVLSTVPPGKSKKKKFFTLFLQLSCEFHVTSGGCPAFPKDASGGTTASAPPGAPRWPPGGAMEQAEEGGGGRGGGTTAGHVTHHPPRAPAAHGAPRAAA